MKSILNIGLLVSLIFILASCHKSEKSFDASGSFEAVERNISAEATGKVLSLNIREGQELRAGDTIGYIDATALKLQAEQIEASINAIGKKTNNSAPQVAILQAQQNVQADQIASLQEQISVLDKEIKRFENLVAEEAAPQKQLDDLLGQKSVLAIKLNGAKMQAEVLKAQITAAKENVSDINRSITSEIDPTLKRLAIIKKQIDDATIVNEYNGTVISQYVYDGEFVSIGKPIYKIADLKEITLKVYVTGDQLSQIKLNDQVEVLTDDGNGAFHKTIGRISWISSKAEFTPKTIQTKEERANKVYAVKILVQNDGTYKIGMYAEVIFM